MPWHLPVCCGQDSLGAPGHGAWWTHLPVSWGEPNKGPLGSRVGTGRHHPSSIYLRKALVELPPTQPNSSKGSHSWLPGGGGCPSLTPGSACLQPLLIVALLLEQHLRALPEPGSVGTNASGSAHKRSASDGIVSFIHCTAGPGRVSHLKAMPYTSSSLLAEEPLEGTSAVAGVEQHGSDLTAWRPGVMVGSRAARPHATMISDRPLH